MALKRAVGFICCRGGSGHHPGIIGAADTSPVPTSWLISIELRAHSHVTVGTSNGPLPIGLGLGGLGLGLGGLGLGSGPIVDLTPDSERASSITLITQVSVRSAVWKS